MTCVSERRRDGAIDFVQKLLLKCIRTWLYKYTTIKLNGFLGAIEFYCGGWGRVRTFEGECQQIYSLPRLTTSVPTHGAVDRT